MKKAITILACILISGSNLFAQFGISSDGSNPDPSAMLDVKSANRGVLLPRLTFSERDAIINPANGLMVFCTNCGTYGALSVYSKISENTGLWRTYAPCSNTAPTAGTHNATSTSITWNWNSTPDALGYKWSISNDYSTATEMGTATSKIETGLTCGILHTRYLWAYNSCGVSTTVILTQSTDGIIYTPDAGVHVPDFTSIIWNWSSVTGADGYKWSTTNNYSNAIDMGTSTTNTETGLPCGNNFTRYVWAYNNSCGKSDSVILTSSTLPAPVTPAEGTHVPTYTSIVWKWNTVPDAIGYKWNTVNNYTTATDMGTATTTTQTNLNCGVNYNSYVWAYNTCGPSISVQLAQSTTACFVCGESITINHLAAGGIAPVDKTVTYGTTLTGITNDTKCWFTSNLGSDHYATSATDNTEPSAGWYWQFDRKQGYKYEGSTRTPSGTWNTSTAGTNNWLAENDPCIILFGNNWRLPTNTEWSDVDAGLSWGNYTHAYNSNLKLHAAGYLDANGGTIQYRGSVGTYWSSTISATNSTNGYVLRLMSASAGATVNQPKTTGNTVRCIRP